MGYRYYFYALPKKFVKEIRECKSEEEYCNLCKKNNIKFDEEDDELPYFPIHRIASEVYNFGKEILFYSDIENKGTPLFNCDELLSRYSDEDAHICPKECFVSAIKSYADHTRDFLEDLIQEKSSNIFDNRVREVRMFYYIKNKLDDWKTSYCTPYNIDLDSPAISNSWDYEYAIFELVRKYKTFDWENNELIFAGW